MNKNFDKNEEYDKAYEKLESVFSIIRKHVRSSYDSYFIYDVCRSLIYDGVDDYNIRPHLSLEQYNNLIFWVDGFDIGWNSCERDFNDRH